MKTILAVTAAITASLPAGLNAAPVNDPSPTMEVRYGDLDLTRASDQLRLKHRLAWAASVLCVEVGTATPAPPPINQTCYRMTLQDASRQMDRAIARADGAPELAAGMAVSRRR